MKKSYLALALATMLTVGAIAPAFASPSQKVDPDARWIDKDGKVLVSETIDDGENYLAALPEAVKGVTPVYVTAEATNFDVVIPLSLLLHVDKDGKVTAATNAKISNNSYGAVRVEGVEVAAKDDWKLQEYGADMSGVKVGTKAIGFAIDNAANTTVGSYAVATDGTDAHKASQSFDRLAKQDDNNVANNIYATIAGVGAKDTELYTLDEITVNRVDDNNGELEIVENTTVPSVKVYGNEMGIKYDGTVPAQRSTMDDTNAADVIFTIDWDEADVVDADANNA